MDNGASSGWKPPVFVDYGEDAPDNSYSNLGCPGSYRTAGNGWARVSGAPFKMYKNRPEEGGHSVPMIAVLPDPIAAGSKPDAFANVRDLLPTFLDLAGVPLPETAPDGQSSLALDGISILPVLTGAASESPYHGKPAGFRNGDLAYLYLDNWKILRSGESEWELYDMATDRAEQHDQAAANPGKLEELLAAWTAYEARIAERALQ